MYNLLIASLGFLTSYFCIAKPNAPSLFCADPLGAETTLCQEKSVSCDLCHTEGSSLNLFGATVKKNLHKQATESTEVFSTETFEKSMAAIMDDDSDADGTSNREELTAGSSPSINNADQNKKSKLVYDTELAFRRVYNIYCGISPQYKKLQELRESPKPEQKKLLHAALSNCLDSDYWKKIALHRLADNRIRPLSTTGYGGQVVLADYRYDYRLFSYILTGDRDSRDLLTAKYHIDPEGNRVEGKIPRQEAPQVGKRIVIGGGQPLEPERRYGMLTTQWYLTNFTMFAKLPRNAASQAYRSYLGLDLAKGEGLMEIPGEPRDVDNRNVKQKECALCHSTLDAAAYSFSTYIGIETVTAFLFNANGQYSASRSNWEADGYILGKKVKDLEAWVKVALESDYFKKNLATMFFEQALDRKPLEHEKAEFTKLWQKLPEDNYNASKLIHRLADTLAFGGR